MLGKLIPPEQFFLKRMIHIGVHPPKTKLYGIYTMHTYTYHTHMHTNYSHEPGPLFMYKWVRLSKMWDHALARD